MRDNRRQHPRPQRPSHGGPQHGAPRAAAGDGHQNAEGQLVFGVEPVRELIAAAPNAVRVLYVRAGAERRFAAEIESIRTCGAQIVIVEEERLNRMAGAGAHHQGIVAIIREYEYTAFETILREHPDPLLVVDGVTDPRNLGAILRSSECAGAGAVVIARDRTVGLTPAAIKSSAGAWVHLRIARCGNVAQALEALKSAGYWIVALAPGGELSLYELDSTRRLAFVVGSEGKGVRQVVRKNSDFVASIPMRGKVESLNVSVAAAVVLFEVARTRAR
jgi:23S rRNA (guanosine2251-2'-O)-methyltransferase